MSNYPDGAEHDSSAPYNQKDPEMEVCNQCTNGRVLYSCCGDELPTDTDSDICPTCHEHFDIKTEDCYVCGGIEYIEVVEDSEEDWADDKADAYNESKAELDPNDYISE